MEKNIFYIFIATVIVCTITVILIEIKYLRKSKNTDKANEKIISIKDKNIGLSAIFLIHFSSLVFSVVNGYIEDASLLQILKNLIIINLGIILRPTGLFMYIVFYVICQKKAFNEIDQ